MKERPILFSGPMVQAILDGQKTQTRRVVTNKEFLSWIGVGFSDEFIKLPENHWSEKCPYGQPGDRLWVRETWAEKDEGVAYRATPPKACWGNTKWKPSIFMPRWASRITLEITDVRVERLKDMTADDALCEGISREIRTRMGWASEESEESFNFFESRHTFSLLWNSINEKRGYGWDTNPFVWVIEFRMIQA